MVNRLADIIYWLVLMIVLIVPGCGKEHTEDTSATEPDAAKRVVAGTFTPRAIRATGGYQSWITTEKLELDSVVTFYSSEGSFYLTDQHHEIYPWLGSVRISALEPEGELVWQLSGESFRALEEKGQVGLLPAPMYARDFAEAVLYMTTAPIRFLDNGVEFDETLVPIRMDGLSYYQIERVGRDHRPYWSQVILYQSADTSFVDMIWFADIDRNRYLAVRGYDYSMAEKRGVLVPAKIEVFGTNAKGVLQQRFVEIDYYSIRTAK